MNLKKVSIIIPTLNEEKYIGNCLESLVSLNNYTNIELEIIVVDNGSADNTISISKKYNVRILVKKGVTVSALRNYGAVNSDGDLLCFVDADCIVHKSWLQEAIKCIINESADAVGSYYAIPDDSGWIGNAIKLKEINKIGEVNFIPAGNIIIKKSIFFAIGGFEESLQSNEDVDICYRLQRNGYKLISNPSIISVHLGTPKKIKELILQQIWHGTNTFTVFLKDVRAIRNVRIVVYTVLNLFILFSIIIGLLLFPLNKYIFLTSCVAFLSINIIATINDWRKVRKNFLHLFMYAIIYGVGRSLSTLKWLWNVFRK